MKEKLKQNLKEYALITIGVLLIAVAIEFFYKPNELATGGITGLSIIITHYFPSLTVGGITFVANIFLFTLGFILIGGDFGIKTLYASFGLSGLLCFIDKYISPGPLTDDLMLAAIFGTIMLAVGLTIVFSTNASTGGTDIIAKILNKYSTLNIGISLLCVDFVISSIGAMTFGLDKGFYSFLCVVLNGPLINKLTSMLNQKKQITVISKKNSEISDYIINELKKGCTYISGSGAYSKEEKEIIYSILGKKELEKVKSFIKNIDENAFFTIGHVEEVQGQ